jgi:hypothetical protein
MEEQAGAGLKIREPAELFHKEEITFFKDFVKQKKEKDILDPVLLVGGGEVAKKKAGFTQDSFDEFINKADFYKNNKGDMLIRMGSLGILLTDNQGQMTAQCYSGEKVISGETFSQLVKDTDNFSSGQEAKNKLEAQGFKTVWETDEDYGGEQVFVLYNKNGNKLETATDDDALTFIKWAEKYCK